MSRELRPDEKMSERLSYLITLTRQPGSNFNLRPQLALTNLSTCACTSFTFLKWKKMFSEELKTLRKLGFRHVCNTSFIGSHPEF
jgi:hypothetical protein